MRKHSIALALLALTSLAWGQTTQAPNMTREAYTAQKDRIEADAKAARAKCDPLQGNAKDICRAQAKGLEKVSKAELEAQYKPSARNEQRALEAKADADYDLAKERCDEQQGHAKDACVEQAKAAQSAAKAQAKNVRTSTTPTTPVTPAPASSSGASSGVPPTPAPASR